MNFKSGHISTFKRKFQEWKEQQDTQRRERKIQLLRKLNQKKKRELSILKRNIDVENDTNELIKIRIIGERKYDSFKSLSKSNKQFENKDLSKIQQESSSSNIKSSKTRDTDSSNETNKTLDVNVSAQGMIPQAPGATVGGDVGVSKTQSTKSMNKMSSTSNNSRDISSNINQQRKNKQETGSNISNASQSKHSWSKVDVGFTHIMPKQTIVFPVQISDPNAVVYMTIIRPTTKETICDNVQIDANFIKIEKIKLEGYGFKIKWQHAIKHPQRNSTTKNDKNVIKSQESKNGIITANDFCQYLSKSTDPVIEDWVIEAIRNGLGNNKYQLTPDNKNEKKENEQSEFEIFERHVYNAIVVATQLNRYHIGNNQNYYKDIKKTVSLNENNKDNKVRFKDQENDEYSQDSKYDDNDNNRKDENRHFNELVDRYIKINSLHTKDIGIKDKPQSLSLLYTDKLCDFIQEQGFIEPRKINFIRSALNNGPYDISNKEIRKNLKKEIGEMLKKYDELKLDIKRMEGDRDIPKDIKKLVYEYKKVIMNIVKTTEDYQKHGSKVKYQEYDPYCDNDSDDEELEKVEKFFQVDGYEILKNWKLEQFFERLADEGWENPLDWVHLDDFILRTQIGFRPGHIQIFNRKFDLWVKKYNEVRQTIEGRHKGKDGTLIVGKNEIKILEPNYNYEFTKVIIREGGKITCKGWSPSYKKGGVLYIKSHHDIVLEKKAEITTAGKGFWGSKDPTKRGYAPPNCPNSGGGSCQSFECGSGGGGHAEPGGHGFTPKKYKYLHYKIDNNEDRNPIGSIHWTQHDGLGDDDDDDTVEDTDAYHGYGGDKYNDDNNKDKLIKGLDHKSDDFNQGKDDEKGEIGQAKKKTIENGQNALGAGGGCWVDEEKHLKRGGTGGGAIRIICNKLIMYDGSCINSNGLFGSNNNNNLNPFRSGGAGGSIWLTVHKDIAVYDNVGKKIKNEICLQCRGGGTHNCQFKSDLKQIGTGSAGRIRIDYHAPGTLEINKMYPGPFVDEGTETEEVNDFGKKKKTESRSRSNSAYENEKKKMNYNQDIDI